MTIPQLCVVFAMFNLENELHCFVYCARLQSLWDWVLTCMAPLYPWIHTLSSTDRLFGFAHSHHLDSNIQVWKLFHAEFIRLIWYSRCRKLFDNELIDDEAIKGMLRSRVQQAVSIHELYLKSTSKATCQSTAVFGLRLSPTLVLQTVGSS
jgi:hypothetical protein